MLHYTIKALQIPHSTSSVFGLWKQGVSFCRAIQNQFKLRLIARYPRVSRNQFQQDLMFYYIINALQKLIYDQFCLRFWIALKGKLPVPTDQFQFGLLAHYPRVSLKQFQDDLMLYYIIKALQKLIYEQFCLRFWIALKSNLPVSTRAATTNR